MSEDNRDWEAFHHQDGSRPRGPWPESMAWPVVFLLGLTAMTVICCLGSLYIVSGMFN